MEASKSKQVKLTQYCCNLFQMQTQLERNYLIKKSGFEWFKKTIEYRLDAFKNEEAYECDICNMTSCFFNWTPRRVYMEFKYADDESVENLWSNIMHFHYRWLYMQRWGEFEI